MTEQQLCERVLAEPVKKFKVTNPSLSKYLEDTPNECVTLIGNDAKFTKGALYGVTAMYNGKKFEPSNYLRDYTREKELAAVKAEYNKRSNSIVPTPLYNPVQQKVAIAAPPIERAPVMAKVIPENLKGNYKKFGIDKYYTKCKNGEVGCVPYEKLGTKDSMNQIQYCGPRVEGETTYEDILVESCKPRNDIVGGKKSRRKRKVRKTKKYNIKK